MSTPALKLFPEFEFKFNATLNPKALNLISTDTFPEQSKTQKLLEVSRLDLTVAEYHISQIKDTVEQSTLLT